MVWLFTQFSEISNWDLSLFPVSLLTALPRHPAPAHSTNPNSSYAFTFSILLNSLCALCLHLSSLLHFLDSSNSFFLTTSISIFRLFPLPWIIYIEIKVSFLKRKFDFLFPYLKFFNCSPLSLELGQACSLPFQHFSSSNCTPALLVPCLCHVSFTAGI